MSESDSSDKFVLDSKPAKIRKAGGAYVQTIPKGWKRLRNLEGFFQSDLEIALIKENGQFHIEIRRVPQE